MTARDLSLDAWTCPGCGQALTVRDPARAGTVVCGACGVCVARDGKGLVGSGKIDLGAHPPRGPVCLGKWARFGDRAFEVIGRIRYGGKAWNWDEWLLRSEQGQYRWLAEDGQRYVFFESFRPSDPVGVEQLRSRQQLTLDGRETTVGEVDSVEVLFFEGELTWRANLGEKVRYVDLSSGDLHYSIEATEEEIRFFKGRVVPPSKIQAIFGRVARDERAADVAWRTYRPASEGVVPGLLWAVFLVFLFYWTAIRPVAAGAGRFPKGTPKSPTVRQGSVHARGYWGGFHGGK